mmetsp:Transcript_8994/g.36696  ORF Transcript_8994/g.36696 Transcript_8994/m.36696 type:complete len:219 (-) Transcript_8994:3099-3755(-)
MLDVAMSNVHVETDACKIAKGYVLVPQDRGQPANADIHVVVQLPRHGICFSGGPRAGFSGGRALHHCSRRVRGRLVLNGTGPRLASLEQVSPDRRRFGKIELRHYQHGVKALVIGLQAESLAHNLHLNRCRRHIDADGCRGCPARGHRTVIDSHAPGNVDIVQHWNAASRMPPLLVRVQHVQRAQAQACDVNADLYATALIWLAHHYNVRRATCERPS